jgi:hypothetical protein
MLGWARYRFHKKHSGTRYDAKLVFLHPAGSEGHVMHSIESRVQNVDALFFTVEWDWYGYDEKRTGTCYAELVCLHPLGFVSHVVHSGAYGARNIDALIFTPR